VFVPAVCEELKISPKQREVLLAAFLGAVSVEASGELSTSVRNAGLHLQRAEQSGDPEQIATAQSELAMFKALRAKATETRDEAVRALLTPAQNKRLFQILLRQEGIRAVTRPVVAESIGMTEEQVAEIQGILAEREAKLKAWRAADRNTPKAQAQIAAVDRVVRKNQNHEAFDDEDRRVMKERSSREKMRTEDFDRFEQTTDALLTRVLNRPQQRRLAALYGPDFDLRLLTREAQPKPEQKPASRGDSGKGQNEKKEGTRPNEPGIKPQ